MIQLLVQIFSIFPLEFIAPLIAIIVVSFIVLVFKLIKLILDAIPFL